MKLKTLLLFFTIIQSSILYAQEKERPANCVFEIKSDDIYKSKSFFVNKFGVEGLPIKHGEKVKVKLNLFTGDELENNELFLSNRFLNVCHYKKYYLRKIEILDDGQPHPTGELTGNIIFHFEKL